MKEHALPKNANAIQTITRMQTLTCVTRCVHFMIKQIFF